jgi:opacity protein-like surface antigen
MKKYIPYILTLISCFIIGAQPIVAQRGQKSAGIFVGYNTCNDGALTGIEFSYQFSSHIRIAPNAYYIFRKDHSDAFSINCDIHSPWHIGQSAINVYPLVGINYTQWSMRHSDMPTSNDSSTRCNRFGLNIGGGIEWFATSTLKIHIEGKYAWLKTFDNGIFNAGIAYVF